MSRAASGWFPKGILVLSDQELFGRTELRREARRRTYETRAIDSFLELSEGDLVVHLTNGIGIYRGMQLLDKGVQKEEHLILEFADAVRLFVPISLIDLVQKYIGASKSALRSFPSWERRRGPRKRSAWPTRCSTWPAT